MKKLLTLLTISLITLSCSKSDLGYNNPYLPARSVNLSIDLRNPEANELLIPNNVYTTYNHGITGIAIRNAGGNTFYAFELTCPNHPVEYDSRLYYDKSSNTVYCKDTSKHNNQEFRYNLITGAALDNSQSYYGLKPYPVTLNNRNNPTILSIRY